MKPLYNLYANYEILEYRRETLVIYYNFQAKSTFSGTLIPVNKQRC
jgi:hypothetical protein